MTVLMKPHEQARYPKHAKKPSLVARLGIMSGLWIDDVQEGVLHLPDMGPRTHKDPTFWLYGPRQGGFQTSWFVASFCLSGLLGPYQNPTPQCTKGSRRSGDRLPKKARAGLLGSAGTYRVYLGPIGTRPLGSFGVERELA